MIELEIFIKSFIDLFASGRSSVKIFLFFLFFLFSTVLFYFRKKDISSKKKYTVLFLVNLLIIFIIGIVLHLNNLFVIQNTIGDKMLYLSESEISSSEINHTHEMKAVFGNLIKPSFKENVDMGQGVVDFVPAHVKYLGLLLLISALFFYSLSILKNEHGNIRRLLFYILISFILLKNSIDGGILNHEVASVLLFFSTYFLIKKNKAVYALLGIMILSFSAVFYFYSFHLMQTFIFILCVYILLFKNSTFLKSTAGAIILLFGILNILPTISYLYLKADKEMPGIIASFVKDFEKNELYSVGNMYIYQTESGSVKEMLKKYSLAINHRPMSIKWKTCIPNTYNTYEFKIYSEKKPRIEYIYKDRYYALEIKSIEENKYTGTLRMESCFSQRFENQIQEGLRELDLLPAIIYQVSKS